ncbi:hypothetical protein LCGC14_0349910 [marine sediment metagenome]|uniref:RmlD-like substrate binding domain-containing protein n=1 Tax=marine sediment metagenome TaxID=412755 RepID=A0A0F9TGS5_9ZZZZ
MNLVIGNGLIGRNLYYYLRRMGNAVILGRDVVSLDGTDWDLPESDVAYICAAETSTEKCERYPEETRRINVDGTIRLAEKLKGFVVWLSSERVFDGSKASRNVNDAVCPTTEYGRQKAGIERILLDMGVTVIRLSKVLGYDVPLFEGWITDLKGGRTIYPYSNMSMSPMSVHFVSDILYKIGRDRMGGLLQVSGDSDLTYDRIAYHFANYIGVDLSLVNPVEAEIGHPNTTLESDFDQPDSWETIYGWCRDFSTKAR